MDTDFSLNTGMSWFPANADQTQVYDGSFRIAWANIQNGGAGGSTVLPVRVTLTYYPSTTSIINGTIEMRGGSPISILPGARGSFIGAFTSAFPIRIINPNDAVNFQADYQISNLTFNSAWLSNVLDVLAARFLSRDIKV